MLSLQGPGLYSHCLVNPKLPYLFSLQYFTPVTALLQGCEVVCLPGVRLVGTSSAACWRGAVVPTRCYRIEGFVKTRGQDRQV